ncbi:MAG: ribonuclease H-like domain-containing protein [Nitrospirales bacterium]
MIESSFCVLSGVGPKTERRLWRRGVGTWTEFLSSGTIPGIGPSRKRAYDAELGQAQAHRAQEDARYFGNKLPACEHWRLCEWLRPRTVYLDIETNSFGQITVVGLYGQGGFTSLVEGESMTRQRLCEELAQYDLLVTFNGTSFDLPVLLASIQGLPLDQPHVDLWLLGRQLCYRGGGSKP